MTDHNESNQRQTAASYTVGSPLLTLKNELLLNAVVRGELPTVRRLLDRHGADINSVNFSGLSCLQLAILNHHTKLAEYLIQKGANIHMKDSEGWSVLHDAALLNNTTLVRKLICKGVSPMLSNSQGELPIDVAGSIAMERLLCEEMCIKGELALARQYYFYLGLQRLSDTEVYELPRSNWARSAVHSGNRSQRHWRSGGPTSAKCHITTGSIPKSFSKTRWPGVHVKNAPATGVTPYQHNSPEKQSSNAVTVPDDQNSNTCYDVSENANEVALDRILSITGCGSHPRSCSTADVGMSALGKVFKETEREESEQNTSNSDSLNSVHSSTSLSSDSNSSLSQVEEVRRPFERHPPPAYEYSPRKSNSSKKPRESKAINSLFQHSSFQLQIGFSLSHLGQGSSLDNEEDFTDLSGDSLTTTTTVRSSPSNSPAINRRTAKLKSSSFDSDSDTAVQSKTTSLPGPSNGTGGQHSPTPIIRQGKSKPAPLRKTVSFADVPPMTRTRPVSYPTGIPNSTATGPGAKSSQKNGSRLNLSPAELAHLSEIFKDNIEKSSNSDEEGEGDFEAGIKALKMKPRKSSIASPQRRRSSDGRRRSVSFQPEVLLQEIVIDGDAKAVSRILESGVIEDVNKMSPAGLTALHQSAIDGNLECAKALVANGANVNCMDVESWTPLHASAMTGRIEFVRFLLSAGANPSLKNNTGETPYDIAKSGQIRKMLLHAMNGKSPDADVFSDGEYSGEEEEEYSHAESDSEDEDSEGTGGLFDSNGTSQKPSLKERLGLNHSSALKNTQETSTSPSPDQDNSDVFSAAVGEHKNHSDILDLPKKSRELTDSTSSYGSLYEPDLERISELDTDSSSRERRSKPALEQPQISFSDTDKVSEDQGISTMDGSTSDCSHRSRILSEDEGTLRDALDRDLVPGSADYKFQEACLYCDIDSVLKMVRHKDEINVNRVNTTSGISALHHSVLEENFALVQHLVKDFEANIHVRDRDGWTPLHAASAVGNIRIAQFLLENGAKASVLNNSCEFPVDVAEDKAIEKLLKNAMLGSVGKRF